MPKHNIRTPNPNDLKELHSIWSTVFGNTDKALFFNFFYKPELSIIAEHEGNVVAMGFLLPVGDLITGCGEKIPCSMIYAMATLPDFRGFGFGGTISDGLINLARKTNCPAVILYPADDSLFNYYNKHTDMREWFYGTEYKIATKLHKQESTESSIISVNEYMSLRENLLSDICHIKYDHQVLEYQSKLCDLYGGGLYCYKTPSGNASVVVERQSNELVIIKELLMSKTLDLEKSSYVILNIASDIALKFPASEYIIRTPALNYADNTFITNMTITKKRYGMLSYPDDIDLLKNEKIAFPWYGLAFD